MPIPGFPAGWRLSVHLKALPFETRADVVAVMPTWMRDDTAPIPVRDAIADGTLYAFARYASDCAAYAASSNPQWASGSLLDYEGAERDVARAMDEKDEDYRARVLGDGALLTPTAIMTAVAALIAPFSTSAPYYFENPDDETFVFDNDISNVDGFYMLDVDQIEASERHYDDRPFARARYAFANDAVNGWGETVVALPNLPLPGTDEPDDPFCFDLPIGPLIDDTGNLTTDAEAIAELAGDVFDEAVDDGSFIVDSGNDVTLVVGRVQSLLSSRCAFNSQVSILIDPNL